MNQWFLAMRPWSLTASAIPVSLGAVFALSVGVFQPWLFALTLLGGVLLQVGTNLLNTYGDFISGVDTPESARTCPQLVTGLFKPSHMKRAGIGALIAAALTGLTLLFHSGWPLAAFGVVGLVGAYGYTTGRLPYKYIGLGPIMVFWLMGPLMTVPAYYIQTGQLAWSAAWIGLPIGFMVTAILHANDLRDIEHDKQAGIHTVAMSIGLRGSLWLYAGMVLCAFVSLAGLALFRIIPLGALLPLALLPDYVRALGPLMRYTLHPADTQQHGENDFANRVQQLEGQSAEWHFKFGVLMLVGILAETGARALWT